jgi:UDP-N-acetylglucosamine 4,6-dehydratase
MDLFCERFKKYIKMELSQKDNFFNAATFLITGGTGSFGNQVVETLINNHKPGKVIIFSRDEKKQFDMRNRFSNHPALQFVIGDVRNRDVVFGIMKNVDYVFHAAALKQVPSCEFFPYEAVQTNIIGANNVLDAAGACEVRKVVVLSTDKAVYPINAMGITKAAMEKLMLAKARINNSKTIFCGVRYGNVMYSRGSVIPLFIEQIQKGIPLTVTNPNMTRYLIPLPEAIDLVMFALDKGEDGDILVKKSPAATIKDIAEATLEIFKSNLGIKIIGIREGEKMHETLITKEELLKADEYENYYRIKNLHQIDYDKYFSKGQPGSEIGQDYTSENTRRLTQEETKNLILSLKEIKEFLK